MSGLDDILGSVLGGGGSGGMMGALLPMLAGMLANGGLNKILAGFQQKGQGAKADSWVGHGANEAVSGEEVRAVLGEDKIAEIATKLGVPYDEAAAHVAEVLPKLVDKATPEGKLPPQGELDNAFERLRSAVSQTG